MEVKVTLVAEQTKMSSEMELTNLVALLSLDGWTAIEPVVNVVLDDSA